LRGGNTESKIWGAATETAWKNYVNGEELRDLMDIESFGGRGEVDSRWAFTRDKVRKKTTKTRKLALRGGGRRPRSMKGSRQRVSRGSPQGQHRLESCCVGGRLGWKQVHRGKDTSRESLRNREPWSGTQNEQKYGAVEGDQRVDRFVGQKTEGVERLERTPTWSKQPQAVSLAVKLGLRVKDGGE